MKDITANNWNQLFDLLYRDSWKKDIGRFRSNYAFRGLYDAHFPLQTTLYRLGGHYRNLEHHLLRNFRKYAHRDVVQRDSIWNWLSVAQHHGLPTRLLDWTYSPFVAMHFATTGDPKKDGVIWCVDYVKAHKLLPSKLRKILSQEGSNAFTVQMLNTAADSLDRFDSLSRIPFVVFFEPPSIDDRIVNQFALFSVASDSTLFLDKWLRNHSDLFFRIIIPSGLKWEIRDKLDQANLNERVLFPGLDGLSKWLTRHYSKRI